jgi:hypothetical protein
MKIVGPKGVEIRDIDDWERDAGPKRKMHWRRGRSAAECARAWCPPSGPCVPTELLDLLQSHTDIGKVEIDTVYPERRVRFDDLKGEPRNCDVVALGRCAAGIVAISIEAKADEPFDLPIGKVIQRGGRLIAKGKKTRSVERVNDLLELLLGQPESSEELLRLRYQLLTGVAGALAVARQETARCAVFAVHEFVSRAINPKRDRNTRDLDMFAKMLSLGQITHLDVGRLYGPIALPSKRLKQPPLYLGKIERGI